MSEKLRFVVLSRREVLPAAPRPLMVVRTDAWNDFGYQVQFHLTYVDEKNYQTHLGTLKVLQRVSAPGEAIGLAKSTVLPESFQALDDSFVSLGQDDDYYKGLHELMGAQAGDVLTALRDIAWLPALAADFEPTSGFRNALMRENGAHRARRFGRPWASGVKVTEKLDFTYVGAIEGAEAEVTARFAFYAEDPVPGRIVGIIGRNAVGKTRFMASLAADLAQIARTSAEKLNERETRFPLGRPLFTRVIAISYSAFDRFKRPHQDSSSSYVYCGIRNDKGILSRSALIDSYRANQARIRERGDQRKWTSYMQAILGDLSAQLTMDLEDEIGSDNLEDKALSLLSSGQSILAHFVTALLAWIQPNSIVLFDEPETHLHPNAVASLFLVLSDILEESDSYAVVATHSPIVIQEIPAKRVLMFQRMGNVTEAEPLGLESFGESVTELTRHVFETDEVDSVYRRTLKELAQTESVQQVIARFEQGLSLSAQAYLLAQYGKKAGGNR
ncbi:AAA family ATPase [Hydrogenophaga sp. T2]|uniref:AAA family ATPase n=1 Tax=Hydrogenophaga sp. T2 TaxID=3132823 RepID=UPI003CEE0667